jgi:hypothetical protein
MVSAVMLAIAMILWILRSMLISIPWVGGSDDWCTAWRYLARIQGILGHIRQARISAPTGTPQETPNNHVRNAFRMGLVRVNWAAASERPMRENNRHRQFVSQNG